ncbi:RNA polymerase II associated protein 2 [Mactra antiquata]
MTTKVDDDTKKAELRKKVEYQVACEERAYRIVERLIDNPITEEMFCNSLQYITPSHYNDILEERAVSKLCGYPVCPNDLGEVMKQKYLISTKTNKVYDLEARKNFCSNKCYKASQHLEKQISNAPVWSRKSLPPIRFELLPLDNKIGRLGNEVIVSKSADVKDEIKTLQKLDQYEENLLKKKQQKTEQPHVSVGEDLKKEDSDEIKAKFENMNISDETGQNLNDEQTNKVSHSMDKNIMNESYNSGNKGKADSERGESSQNKGKKTKKSGKASKISSNVDKSKTDYLMQLLDKRKALLSKMVDDQDKAKISVNNDSNAKHRVPDNGQDIGKIDKDIECRRLEKGGHTSRQLVSDVNEPTGVQTECDDGVEHSNNLICDVKETVQSGSHTDSVIPHSTAGSSSKYPDEERTQNVESLQSTIRNKSDSKSVNNENEALIKTESKPKKEALNKNEVKTKRKITSTLEYICAGVKCWVTMETTDYLHENCKDKVDICIDLGKPEFNKQYKDLVAKVDAQEKDFDALLGEESMESDVKNQAVAPLPHFDVLKDELQENQKRVEHFMKGSFVYKVTEKNINLKSDSKDNSIVLPTVDRYDQIVKRQKITLEIISKVLPEVLSPLNLLIRDIFTELRQLVSTFNLTSDNIVYKPSEWILISIVLLRM